MVMETISIYKAFGGVDIENSEEYGLSKYFPLCTKHLVLGREFVEQLTYEGEKIRIGDIKYLRVDFGKNENRTQSNVIAYQILRPNGKEISTIYVFERCYHENLKAPKGFKFEREETNFKSIIEKF